MTKQPKDYDGHTYHAPYREKAAWVHLFGIKYDRELGYLASSDIAARAQLSPGNTNSYGTELAKGRKLSKYVEVRPEYFDRIG